jgi:hypothetical protein
MRSAAWTAGIDGMTVAHIEKHPLPMFGQGWVSPFREPGIALAQHGMAMSGMASASSADPWSIS